MELKEIEKQIQLLTGCSSLESGTIMIFIESYGKEQYNQALLDAAGGVKCKRYQNDESGKEVNIVLTDNYFDSHDGYSYEVDKQSILNLKKH